VIRSPNEGPVPDAFNDVFALVCGQNHCYSLGGDVLPFCRRCTGLYVEAAFAGFLYAVLRPRPTAIVLWAHGLLLLLMVPFGYHVIPHGGLVRTLTGQLFALGLVYYLMLVPADTLDLKRKAGTAAAYAVGSLASLILLQVAISAGGHVAGAVLAWVGFAGLLFLGVLALANVLLVPRAVWQLVRHAKVSAAP
jgi:hypothetical protein